MDTLGVPATDGSIGIRFVMPQESALARAHRAVARAMLYFRIGGLIEIVVVGGADVGRYRDPALVAGLLALVVAESVAVVGVCLRTGSAPSAWIGADVVFSAAALPACAALTAPPYFHTWANFMYPYSIIIDFGAGAAFPRLPPGGPLRRSLPRRRTRSLDQLQAVRSALVYCGESTERALRARRLRSKPPRPRHPDGRTPTRP
ncbi:hypothetical protein [Amycolatopsis sp. NPDC004378]